MRKNSKVLLFIFTAALLCQCVLPLPRLNEKVVDDTREVTVDTLHLLCQYWQLSDAENPTARDVSHTDEDSILYEPGIVFMSDSTLLENPAGEMSYARFRIRGDGIHADFDDGRKVIFQISRISNNELRLKRLEKGRMSELIYSPTQTYWPDAAGNPFAKENYAWCLRPRSPETADAIKARVRDCIRFYAYYLRGFVDGGADKIDFRGLPCCFHWYAGGIGVQSEKKLDRKWIRCFYSLAQAQEGRQMIDDVISKKYKWDEKETNWIKQSAPVLLQIRDSL